MPGGALDTCHYCVLVRGQEALERLLASDLFAEAPTLDLQEAAGNLSIAIGSTPYAAWTAAPAKAFSSSGSTSSDSSTIKWLRAREQPT